MKHLLFFLKTLFRRNEMERSMKEEIQSHMELQALELQKQGISRAEAVCQAKRMFGKQIAVVEDCRASWGVRLWDEFVNDIAYSWVQLRKHPLFSLVAIFSLGIGIGINLSLFSALNGILLKPLPIERPEQLREINWEGPRINGYISGRLINLSDGFIQCNAISHLLFQDFRKQAAPIADIFCWANTSSFVVDLGHQKRTDSGILVSDNYFEALGAKPLLGRLRVDEALGEDPVRSVWLSFSAWQRDFGEDPHIIGKSAFLSDEAFTIIGVLPQGFTGLQKGRRPRFYFPLEAQAKLASFYDLHSPSHFWLTCGARLKNLHFEEQLQDLLNSLLENADMPFVSTSPDSHVSTSSLFLGDDHPDQPRKNGPVSEVQRDDEKKVRAILKDASRGIGADNQYMGRNLSIPMIMSGILLLVSCLNLAGLQFSRNFRRIRELNIRAALGASRRRLIRQFMTETLILTFAGAINGIVLSILSYKWLNLHFVYSIESIDSTPDIRIFALLVALVAVCTLLVGLYPTLRVTRIHHNLHVNYQSDVSSQTFRLGKVAISTQIICAILLIYAAFLYGKTLINLYQTDVGFDKTSLLVFTLQGEESYRKTHPNTDIRRELAEQINGIPGVEEGTYSNMLLLSNWMYSTGIAMSQFEPTSDESIQAYQMEVAPGFFTTLGIPLKEGEGFDRQVEARNSDKVIVTESLAHRVSPDSSAIGRTFENNGKTLQIIGVCGNIRYHSVREPADYVIFFPTTETTDVMFSFALPSSYFYVRTRMPPLSLSKTIVNKVTQSHPDIFIENVQTLEMNIDRLVRSERNLSVLSILFSSITVLLICIGLFALVSFDVATRTPEIGVRLALGANRKKIMRYVLKRALAPLIPGLVVGIPLAIFLKRYIQEGLYNISGFEPIGLMVAVSLVTLMALLAALIPSIRSTRLDPATVLRSE